MGCIRGWLPSTSTQPKSCVKTVAEIIPCYFKYFNNQKRLFTGKKSSNFPLNKAITERAWKSAQKKSSWKKPIKEGQKYLACLNSDPKFRYQNVADEFGVSKARVSQMIALIRKLPKEILDYFFMENNSDAIKCFSERKLRPLILMDSDKEKIKFFRAMT